MIKKLCLLNSKILCLHKFCKELSLGKALLGLFFLGALNALTMPPAYISWLYLITLPLFIWILEGRKTKKSAFLCGWSFGSGFFIVSLYWINFALFVDFQLWWWVLPLSVFVGPALLGLYTGFAGLLPFILNFKKAPFVLATILSLMLFEWLRSILFTGFPWNLSGYTWMNTLSMAQNLSWAGIFGLSLLTFLWFSFMAYIPHLKTRFGQAVMLCLILSFISCWLYGSKRLRYENNLKNTSTAMRLVQPNIAQKEKWLNDKRWEHFSNLIKSSQEPSKLSAPITHFIWPETAITFPLQATPAAQQLISKILPDDKTVLLSGNLHYSPAKNGKPPSFYNSLVSINGGDNRLKYFHKFHLVPFGEYIPFRSFISIGAIGSAISNTSDFTAGDGPYSVTSLNTPTFSPLICYEVIFSGEVTQPNNRPQWLLNITNDAWYGHTAGPYQHLAITQARAIEEGLPLVRAANTGISAVFSPYGRIIHSLPLGASGNIDFYLPKPLKNTFFASYKNTFFYSIWILLFTFACIQNRRS